MFIVKETFFSCLSTQITVNIAAKKVANTKTNNFHPSPHTNVFMYFVFVFFPPIYFCVCCNPTKAFVTFSTPAAATTVNN